MTEKYWYYVKNDEQAGPVPESELARMLIAGELYPDTPVWTKGLLDWIPANTVEGLCGGVSAEPPPLSQVEEPAVSAGARHRPRPDAHIGDGLSRTRPWVRYFARSIDVFIGTVVLGVVVGLTRPEFLLLPDVLLGMLSFFSWIFVEASLLSLWGTTPGKWILKTKLHVPGGGKPTYFEALKRSFLVWLTGIGMGLPVLSLITLMLSYRRLVRDGTTLWDRDSGFTVTHERIGVLRIVLTILAFAGFALIISVE